MASTLENVMGFAMLPDGTDTFRYTVRYDMAGRDGIHLDDNPSHGFYPVLSVRLHTLKPPHGIMRMKIYKGHRYSLGHKK